jgi:hypothetical protein
VNQLAGIPKKNRRFIFAVGPQRLADLRSIRAGMGGLWQSVRARGASRVLAIEKPRDEPAIITASNASTEILGS